MVSPYYKAGNYIYECKTSPGQNYLNKLTLKDAVSNLKKYLKECEKQGYQPSGFRYVFPINRIDSEGQQMLEKLKESFPNLDIRYYDCDAVDNLVSQLTTVQEASSLVSYIQKARGK